MKDTPKNGPRGLSRLLNRMDLKLRPKLILIFLIAKVIPIILLTIIAVNQIMSMGRILRDIAVADSSKALNDSAIENIERMTTDTALGVADFLSQRDNDIRYLAGLPPSDEAYRIFSQNITGKLTSLGVWTLAEDGMSWIQENPYQYAGTAGVSSNTENNDEINGSGFNYRPPEFYQHDDVPLYDEITFVDLDGNEIYKYVSPDSTKKNYPLNPEKRNVSVKSNTYIKAENYFEELKKLKPGEIYVSEVIGAYVGTNYIGMYTPGVLLNSVPPSHPNYDLLQETARLPVEEFIEAAKRQAYAGKENPVGQRFEGIVRWAAPVTDVSGSITGYVTMALNHDHIMEFVDYITPMNGRYTELPSAYEGNYAFIWDYMCRSICHPRHHSIVGYNPLTGEPQAPWLEGTTDPDTGAPKADTPFWAWYDAGGEEWLESNPTWDNLSETPAGVSWGAFYAANKDDRDILPQFGEKVINADTGDRNNQSRSKTPATALTKAGFVGLDGRYLNNAPQCTGWMDLTESGGSGSFYILWSGLYKLTTAGAIPYYTGQYAPENQAGSKRGFAFVAIGAGLDDFTGPAQETEVKLTGAINRNLVNSIIQLACISLLLFALVVMIAVLLSSYLTDNINLLIDGISHFRSGKRQFRLRSTVRDEFGTLAKSFDDMADSIVDSVKEPLSIIDMDHRIIYMNDYALDVTGKSQEEVAGLLYSDISIYPPGSKYDPVAALYANREADVLFQKESDRYYKGTANYFLDQNGGKIGFMIITNDVTEIEIARQKAEQASVAKSNFLSNMSHEMRTPMNAIIGMTSIAAATPDIEKKDYALKKIQDASAHLLGVINDILDMSKIEANKFDLSVAEFVFEKMLQRVIDVVNFRIDEKRHKLTVYVDPAIPPVLIGDDQRLAQVITNLLTNAVKFTPDEGSIHLMAGLKSEVNGICTLLISISDTGIGISEEQKNRLFNAFVQAETSTTRKYGGTGLGLVISRSIVNMMDGQLWIDSAPDEGSKFSFTVCLARGKNGNKRMLSPDLNLDNTRTLAVDDDPDVLTFFKEAARQIGVACDTAISGPEALALIKEKGSYNIYFLDWNMPEMDGIELARRINESGADNSVIIMISATDWSVIQESARKAGVTGYLPKPLFMTAIADCINECLGKPEQSEKNAGADTVISLEGRHILLAEDVDINREIVMALLEPTNLEIDCAVNGAEAVEMFVADPAKYEMIFMDVQMPEMDGYTATRNIRASGLPRAEEIPIVAMTANVFKEDIENCLNAGMNGHIGKPFSFDEVIAVLIEYLG